jgi:hypothetical protein
VSAELNQDVHEFCMEVLGPEATLYGDYALRDIQRSADARSAGATRGEDCREPVAGRARIRVLWHS